MHFTWFQLPAFQVSARLMVVVGGVVFGPLPLAFADDHREAGLEAAASTAEVQPAATGDDRWPGLRDDSGQRGAQRAGWAYGWHWRADATERPSRYQGRPAWRARTTAPYGRAADGYAWRADGAVPSDRFAPPPYSRRYASGRSLSYSERRLLADEALIRRQPWRSVPSDSWEGQRWRDRQVGLNGR